ncbi:hypothetical protein DV702_13040 [Sporosarcina sp. PTS2304]|uniref:hypothetical protein n=1 Tax=Sporosarcina sp. PTS2304 TaxID=2283194 RepID=UPI000E0D8CDB|nr:hypothetical protein [Sporosarcina sp. PTS2304]AXI00566.1 hypothetical protein DV702_13040 [Sporosarcina sp. PTS2304]
MNSINNYHENSISMYTALKAAQSSQVANEGKETKELKKPIGSIIVELSEDSLAKSRESKFQVLDGEWREKLENQHLQNQKIWEESGAVVQNVEKRIIPNIQLNEKLVNSLDSSDAKVIDAAHSIINDNLLIRDATTTEEERKALISLGLEKAKYLAENYMTKEKATDFLSAMEEIAKIAVNGGNNQNGVIQYDIPRGPLVGAPDDYINEFDVMKKNDPTAWHEYSDLMNKAVKSGDTEGMISAMKHALNWSKQTHKENPQIFDEQIKHYSDWKEQVANSKIPDLFSEIDRTTKESFLISADKLNDFIKQETLERNIKAFLII